MKSLTVQKMAKLNTQKNTLLKKYVNGKIISVSNRKKILLIKKKNK